MSAGIEQLVYIFQDALLFYRTLTAHLQDTYCTLTVRLHDRVRLQDTYMTLTVAYRTLTLHL